MPTKTSCLFEGEKIIVFKMFENKFNQNTYFKMYVMKYATMFSTIFIIYVLLSILSMFMFTLTGHSGQFYLPVLIN